MQESNRTSILKNVGTMDRIEEAEEDPLNPILRELM